MPANFSINHRATFKLPVKFPLPTGEVGVLTFECTHMKMSEILAAEKPVSDRLMNYDGPNFQLEMAHAHADVIQVFATGWDAEEEFNHDNLAAALDLHVPLYGAFAGALRATMAGEREKS